MQDEMWDRIIVDVIPELMDQTCDPAMAAYTTEQIEAWLRWLVDNLKSDVAGCPVCRVNDEPDISDAEESR